MACKIILNYRNLLLLCQILFFLPNTNDHSYCSFTGGWYWTFYSLFCLFCEVTLIPTLLISQNMNKQSVSFHLPRGSLWILLWYFIHLHTWSEGVKWNDWIKSEQSCIVVLLCCLWTPPQDGGLINYHSLLPDIRIKHITSNYRRGCSRTCLWKQVGPHETLKLF